MLSSSKIMSCNLSVTFSVLNKLTTLKNEVLVFYYYTFVGDFICKWVFRFSPILLLQVGKDLKNFGIFTWKRFLTFIIMHYYTYSVKPKYILCRNRNHFMILLTLKTFGEINSFSCFFSKIVAFTKFLSKKCVWKLLSQYFMKSTH